jgi:hypothetical protein
MCLINRLKREFLCVCTQGLHKMNNIAIKKLGLYLTLNLILNNEIMTFFSLTEVIIYGTIFVIHVATWPKNEQTTWTNRVHNASTAFFSMDVYFQSSQTLCFSLRMPQYFRIWNAICITVVSFKKIEHLR